MPARGIHLNVRLIDGIFVADTRSTVPKGVQPQQYWGDTLAGLQKPVLHL